MTEERNSEKKKKMTTGTTMTTTTTTAREPIVAIDGPAGSGKGTISSRLADRFGYVVIDTGAIYRAVALLALREGISLGDASRLAERARRAEIRLERRGGTTLVFVDAVDVSEAIRAPEVSEAASRISALPAVREALLGLQRALGRAGGVVAEGRDIGTVVFPGADVKFFLTASEAERARRRTLQLREAGEDCDEGDVRAAIRRRDEADSSRAVAPLRQADDALLVDSSALSIEEVVDRMSAHLESVRAGRRTPSSS